MAQVVGSTRQALLVLWASVGFVLLVACVNIINLLLARSSVRAHDTSIRAELGASRWRLVRQMLAESAVLAAAGGVVGVALAYGLAQVWATTSPSDVPRLQDATLNWTVLMFTAAICLLSGVIVGVVPALGPTVNLGETLFGQIANRKTKFPFRRLSWEESYGESSKKTTGVPPASKG